jgi:hypothetical protein
MFFDNEGDPTLAAQELKAIADAESSPPSGPSSYTPSDLDSGLANLHLQGDSSLFAIHTSATVQNGKGAFATRDIQKGDLILSEKPIFSFLTNTPKYGHVEAAIRDLSPADLDGYLSLHNAHNECSCYPNPLQGIFGTNAFTLDGNWAVCVRASRFNHSCSPNAWYSFNSDMGELEHPCSGYHSPRKRDLRRIHRQQTCVGKLSSIEAGHPAHSVSFHLRVFRLLSPRGRIQDERCEASEGE